MSDRMVNGTATHDVSVIIRTKDRPVLLSRALYSLTQQVSANFEIIIVNDGGDATKVHDIIAKLGISSATVLSNIESVGRAKAFNQALQAAQARYIACLDDDDTYTPNFTLHMAKELDDQIAKDGTIGGIVCRCTEVYEKLLTPQPTDYLNYKNHVVIDKEEILFEYNCASYFVSPYFYYIGRENFLPVQTLFRRDLLLKHGGFAEANDVLEDRPVYHKILLDHKIYVLNEYLANHHTRLTRTNDTNANSMHDNNSYDWGQRFADFYIDGYYQKTDTEKFIFTVLRDAFRDFKWESQSEHQRRANFNYYRRQVWRMLKRNAAVVALWSVLWAIWMIGFSVIGGYIVKYWL